MTVCDSKFFHDRVSIARSGGYYDRLPELFKRTFMTRSQDYLKAIAFIEAIKYLSKNNINADVIKINGSVELTPYIGIADCICDLVSSGVTLEANNLIEFKTLMTSQAVLISPVELKNVKQINVINLVKRFEGVINAADSKYVMLNVDSGAVDTICNLLPGADSPTIIPLQKDNKVAIHALCKEPVFWETMEKLKSNGASSILVLPVEKILN